MISRTLVIPARFNGPPGSGNGGYVCGLVADALDGAAEITLRAPPPLETPLTLRGDGATAELRHGETLLAEGRTARLDWSAPPAPALADAEAASGRYAGLQARRFGACFVCGAARDDGMNVFTGPLGGGVAGVWRPGADLGDEDGRVRAEFLYGALDCPTYWALPGAGEVVALLARMTVALDAPLPPINAPLIVAAWPIAVERRKRRAASALYDAGGGAIARAEALWIELKPE